MAKRKPTQRPKRKIKDKRSAPTGSSARSRENQGPVRPKPPAKAQPLTFLFSSKDVESLLVRILNYFTIARTLGITLLLLALLLPLGLWIRWDDINQNMGNRYFSTQQWELALESYEAFAPEDQDAIITAMSMARCYLETKQIDKAAKRILIARKGLESVASKRIKGFTNDINALQGWVHFDSGKTGEALITLDKIIASDRNHLLTNYLLARHMLETKNLRSAGTFFQVLSKAPEYAPIVEEYKQAMQKMTLEIPESEFSGLPESTTSTLSQKP